MNATYITCPFNTNIPSLSLTDFCRYTGLTPIEGKALLAELFNSKTVTSSAKSWKSPYFIRNAAVYLSNQTYLAKQESPEVLEADEIAAAEHEADLLEGDLDLLMAELEAAGLAGEEAPEVLLVSADEPTVPTDIATTKVDARELVLALDGRKAADRKAFRRLVRNHFSANDLPWTIEKGTYWLADPNNIYCIALNGADIEVTLEPTSNF